MDRPLLGRYNAADIARLIFRRDDMVYSDAHPRDPANQYDAIFVDEDGDENGRLFEELRQEDSTFRPHARRAAEVHDRYHNGDLSGLWRNAPDSQAGRGERALLFDRQFLPVLDSLRRVTTFRHNILATFETGNYPFELNHDHATLRILFAHDVHMLRQRFRAFCMRGENLPLSADALTRNVEWNNVLRSVRQRELPLQPTDPVEQDARSTNILDYGVLLLERLNTSFREPQSDSATPDASQAPKMALDGDSREQAATIRDSLQALIFVLERFGRLSLADSFFLYAHHTAINLVQ